jgi:hypothetical protein
MNADQRGLKTKISSALIGVHPRLKTFSPVSPNLPATMAQREFTKRTQSHLYRRRSLPAVFLVSDTPHHATPCETNPILVSGAIL